MKQSTSDLFTLMRIVQLEHLSAPQSYFYSWLPDAFTTQQAKQAARNKLASSTVERYLAAFHTHGYLAYDLDDQGNPIPGHHRKPTQARKGEAQVPA